jgi:hypothetical protein
MQGPMIALQYYRKAGKRWFGASGASGAAISGVLSAVSLSARAGKDIAQARAWGKPPGW